MKLYAGFDLHSRSGHLAVLDQNGKKVFKANLANDTKVVTLALEPYRESLVAIAVESTFNWYWLVDWASKEMSLRAQAMDFHSALALVEHIATPVWNSQDSIEAKKAFLEKRKPEWRLE